MEAGLFGLDGVALGAALASAFGLWRLGLDAQGAARVIRFETIENRERVELVLNAQFHPYHLKSDGWNGHRIALAPFLKELEYTKLAWCYSRLDQIPRMVEADLKLAKSQGLSDRAKAQLNTWVTEAEQGRRLLRAIESKHPLRLAFSVLRRRSLATTDELEKFIQDSIQREQQPDEKQQE